MKVYSQRISNIVGSVLEHMWITFVSVHICCVLNDLNVWYCVVLCYCMMHSFVVFSSAKVSDFMLVF